MMMIIITIILLFLLIRLLVRFLVRFFFSFEYPKLICKPICFFPSGERVSPSFAKMNAR